MHTSQSQTLADVVLEFFNAVIDPYKIHFRIEDDPSYYSPKGRSVNLITAQAILDARATLPNNKFVAIEQIDQVEGVVEDTLHDLLLHLL